jgi:hypothetical protein
MLPIPRDPDFWGRILRVLSLLFEIIAILKGQP